MINITGYQLSRGKNQVCFERKFASKPASEPNGCAHPFGPRFAGTAGPKHFPIA
jgi:hypothetical protein